jgi:hypothetical protein
MAFYRPFVAAMVGIIVVELILGFLLVVTVVDLQVCLNKINPSLSSSLASSTSPSPPLLLGISRHHLYSIRRRGWLQCDCSRSNPLFWRICYLGSPPMVASIPVDVHQWCHRWWLFRHSSLLRLRPPCHRQTHQCMAIATFAFALSLSRFDSSPSSPHLSREPPLCHASDPDICHWWLFWRPRSLLLRRVCLCQTHRRTPILNSAPIHDFKQSLPLQLIQSDLTIELRWLFRWPCLHLGCDLEALLRIQVTIIHLFSPVVRCGLLGPVAPTSNCRYARSSILLQAPLTPLQPSSTSLSSSNTLCLLLYSGLWTSV